MYYIAFTKAVDLLYWLLKDKIKNDTKEHLSSGYWILRTIVSEN
jgi:hypothetical protein